MDRIETSGLSRDEWLQVDELCDEMEAGFQNVPGFNADQFLMTVNNERVRRALESELRQIRSQTMAAAQKTCTVEVEAAGGVCASPLLEAGTIIDDFELVERIGMGATAVVWKARHIKLDRYVALKFPTIFWDDIARRLLRESKAVARLRHPNIVSIYEIRIRGDHGYLVSEFIDGMSLNERMQEGSLSIEDSVDLLICITESIAYSHSMNVIHRDIKPQNILIDSQQVPYVVDFGLARVLHQDLAVLTNEGDLIGTPAYMSPEQATGNPDVTEASDVYSLGVLMFQLLTGELPFRGNIQSVIHKILHDPAPWPRQFRPEIPRDLETICLKCLKKEPNERFPSAQDLAFDLRRFRNGEPIASRPMPRLEKLWRWARRKPMEATLTGLLVACVIGLLAGSLAFAMAMDRARGKEVLLRVQAQNSEQAAIRLKGQVERALRESVYQGEVAEFRARESENSIRLLKSVFHETEPFMWILKGDGVGGGDPPSLMTLFRNAAARIESEYHSDLRTKASLLETLGDSCRSPGFFELSEELLLSAQAYRKQMIPTGSETTVEPAQRARDRFESVRNAFMLAKLKHDLGRLEEAERDYHSCLDAIPQFSGELAKDAGLVHGELLVQLGRLNLMTQNNQTARQHFQAALLMLNSQSNPNTFLIRASELGVGFSELKPGEIPATGMVAEFFQQDSWAQRLVIQFTWMMKSRSRKNFGEAARYYQNVLGILREKLPEEHQWHLLALGDYADVQWHAGYYDEARKAIEIAIRHGERIAPDHIRLVRAHIRVGKELIRGNQIDAGMSHLEKALEKIRQQPGAKTVNVDLWLELIDQFGRAGRTEEAQELCHDLEELREQWMAVQTAWFKHLEAYVYAGIDPAHARKLRERSLKNARSIKEFPENGIWCDRLARIFLDAGDCEQAVRAAQAAIEFDSSVYSLQHPRIANRRVTLGNCLMAHGDIAAAKTEFAAALEIRKKFLDSDNRLIDDLQTTLDSL